MRQQRGADQVIVGDIGQQAGMATRIVVQSVDGAEPHILSRQPRLRIAIVLGLHDVEFKGRVAARKAAHGGWQFLLRLDQLAQIRQRFGRWHVRHRQLVFNPLFRLLERSGHMEDLCAMLNGHHATAGKTAAIAAAIHLVDDGCIEIAAPQEICMQRMHAASLYRGVGRAQCLAQHLAAEHLR